MPHNNNNNNNSNNNNHTQYTTHHTLQQQHHNNDNTHTHTTRNTQQMINTKLIWWTPLVVAALAISFVSLHHHMLGTDRDETVTYRGKQIHFTRTQGVATWSGDSNVDFAFGLGYSHAKNRLVQMCLYRAIAEGRTAEYFLATDKTVDVDIATRTHGAMRYATAAVEAVVKADASKLDTLQAYADGVNSFMSSHWRPLEFMLVGYHPGISIEMCSGDA